MSRDVTGICMHLLYPSDPLDPKAVDETYAEEHAAVVACGLGASLFSVEYFETGTFKPRPALSAQTSVLYRGWMLTVPRYTELAAGIEAKGAVPFTSVDE